MDLTYGINEYLLNELKQFSLLSLEKIHRAIQRLSFCRYRLKQIVPVLLIEGHVMQRDEEGVEKLYDVPTAWPLEHKFRDQPLQTEQWTFRRLPVCLTGGCQTGQKKKKTEKNEGR